MHTFLPKKNNNNLVRFEIWQTIKSRVKHGRKRGETHPFRAHTDEKRLSGFRFIKHLTSLPCLGTFSLFSAILGNSSCVSLFKNDTTKHAVLSRMIRQNLQTTRILFFSSPISKWYEMKNKIKAGLPPLKCPAKGQCIEIVVSSTTWSWTTTMMIQCNNDDDDVDVHKQRWSLSPF